MILPMTSCGGVGYTAPLKWAPPGQHLILVTSEGRIIGVQRQEVQMVRNFIGQSDNADQPKRKKVWLVEMVGPFSIRDGEDNYQLYLIRPANSPQSDFINLMFDRPLLLLIATMLISAPLLLWLAWSLAKPARKLKNAADDVARGNLKQHPELESGPQEFFSHRCQFQPDDQFVRQNGRRSTTADFRYFP